MSNDYKDNVDKRAILDALTKFVMQRPGLEFENYGEVKAYRTDQRHITRSLADYWVLLSAVLANDKIGGEELRDAAKRAYSGRLTINTDERGVTIDYCTGQYFPTEYRNAACALLALALRTHARDSMGAPTSWRVESSGEWIAGKFVIGQSKQMPLSEASELQKRQARLGVSCHIVDYYEGLNLGDWLRRYFMRRFGRGIAYRWFQ